MSSILYIFVCECVLVREEVVLEHWLPLIQGINVINVNSRHT